METDIENKQPKMNTGFSIDKAFSDAWNVFKNNFGVVIIAILLYIIIAIVPEFLLMFIRQDYFSFTFFLDIIHGIILFVFQLFLFKLFLGLLRKKDITMGRALDKILNLSLQIRVLGGVLLYTIIIFAIALIPVIIGFAFEIAGIRFLAVLFWISAVVISVIVAIKLFFVDYFIIDKNIGPIEGIKASYRATAGSTFKLFLLILILMFINLIGVLALIIGVLFTAVITYICSISVYDQLQRENNREVSNGDFEKINKEDPDQIKK